MAQKIRTNDQLQVYWKDLNRVLNYHSFIYISKIIYSKLIN